VVDFTGTCIYHLGYKYFYVRRSFLLGNELTAGTNTEQSSPIAKENLFWRLYATCYDTISKLDPYQELLRDIAHRLEIKKGDAVLDAGCGTGNLEALIGGSEVSIFAVDFSETMLARARMKYAYLADFNLLDLSKPLPFKEHTFDRIACCNTLYTLPNPEFTISEFSRTLRDNGRLVIATPISEPNPMAILKGHVKKRGIISILPLVLPLILVGIFNQFIVSNKTYHFLTSEELRNLLEDSGFHVSSIDLTYAKQDLLAVCQRRAAR
jgi:ubiquinone/menaquinone biosynthesis C-methylase UbiE